MNIKQLRTGCKFKLTGYGASKHLPLSYRRRLIALGLLPNTEFTLVRVAPFGDPIEIKVREESIILRKHEMCQLTIEPLL